MKGLLMKGAFWGADVLPFLSTRLPEDVRASVHSVNLPGLGDTASFEFHLANWVPEGSGHHFGGDYGAVVQQIIDHIPHTNQMEGTRQCRRIIEMPRTRNGGHHLSRSLRGTSVHLLPA